MTDPTSQLDHWIPVGAPGFTGDAKANRRELLDGRFGADGWRWAWVIRGEIVGFDAAIAEYEQAYRVHLQRHPNVVDWLVHTCGNVYDYAVENVHDADYRQAGPAANHYQDISVRRVVAELTGPHDEAGEELTELTDLGTGATHLLPRAPGFLGDGLAQIREPDTPAFFLSPAVVPVHDPALLPTMPQRLEWYHGEGCGHLSVEAFWQMSKLIEVRWDRFETLGELRRDPLRSIE